MLLPTCLPPTSGLPVLLLLHTSVPHCFVAFILTAFLQLPQLPQHTSSASSQGRLVLTRPHPLPTYLPLPYLPTYTRLPTLNWTVSATPVSLVLRPFLAGQVRCWASRFCGFCHSTRPHLQLS
ncbi:hypothetical protein B0T18DRAFT_421478 [Schizothecium vesticola]|uniref:Uncharacterized protein n=1 Tax=Schizothecium vesticola TaxID=314040 RepID=A0AA40BQ30_9PEZI|nr:hypothetical protein B0T18DRAFT_421478 [Schizothecium vesticola]